MKIQLITNDGMVLVFSAPSIFEAVAQAREAGFVVVAAAVIG
jgi:predicted ABC-type ATPase